MKKQATKSQHRKPVRPVVKKRPNPAARKAHSGRKTEPAKAKAKPQPSPAKAGAARVVSNPAAKPVAKTAPPPPRPAPDKQQQYYEEAVRLFHARKFDRADALFQKATEGPNRAVAHHAQVHSQICQQRLRPPEVTLKTADDHYNYAVTLMNARRLHEAAEHLQKALHLAPRADHLHYALAATEALLGNPQGAYERLKKAIDLQPRNRILARGDADFAGVLEYPPLASLLHRDRFAATAPKP